MKAPRICVAQAVVVGVLQIDVAARRGRGPWVDALLVASGSGILPLSFSWQKSTVPDAERVGFEPVHTTNEAILLSDRIVMMTNGPAATIGEIFEVPFGRPRSRDALSETPEYYNLRNEIIRFLYERHALEADDAA